MLEGLLLVCMYYFAAGSLTTERGWDSSSREEGDLEKYLGWRSCLRAVLGIVDLTAWRKSWGTSFDAMVGVVLAVQLSFAVAGGLEDGKSFDQLERSQCHV